MLHPTGIILMIVVALVGWLVQAKLQSKFKKYSQIPVRSRMTGRDVALKMLHDNGIYDVQVISVRGQLTDHYNPLNKTINLSESVYGSYSVAAAAVAAHETGHAIQHARAYAPLKMRSALVPVVSISSRFVMWVILAGFLLIHTLPALIWIGIAMFAMTTLFSFITLPVEVNASNRAIAWLENTGITDGSNQAEAVDALGRLYVCGGSTGFAGDACILYNDSIEQTIS